jgi:hypothetical protein
LLVAGCWLLVAGCWLLVAGCWLLVAGCWLLVAGCWLLELCIKFSFCQVPLIKIPVIGKYVKTFLFFLHIFLYLRLGHCA